MIRPTMDSFSQLANILKELDGPEFDHIFWEPIADDEEAKIEFDKHIKTIDESQNWPVSLNWKKGKVLEDFTVFLFSRFQDVNVNVNKRPGDNETDIETILSEKAQPPFMLQTIGPRIICECKNKKTTSIDVGMVTKLAELIPRRGSKFGVFISIKGMGGYAWRYGEGKRKKIMYSTQLPIISFTVDELRVLRNGSNFYTMIREKYYSLVDEVDDETADIPNQQHYEYSKRLNEMIEHFRKCNLMVDEEAVAIKQRLISKYGPLE
ncbi:restriction endonuclease [Priestia megaterium]|uniref:restriction endonuclease n=1 Tax=Priestia megaterium TaxID=1404 RepID=UPI0030002122